MIAGQVGLVGHIAIADGVKIAAQSGILSDIKQTGSTVMGTPAMDLKDYLRSSVIIRRLPDLKKKVDELERRVKSEEQQNSCSFVDKQ